MLNVKLLSVLFLFVLKMDLKSYNNDTANSNNSIILFNVQPSARSLNCWSKYDKCLNLLL